MTEMGRGQGWLTDDPLGLGSLLSDAYSVAQLMAKGYFLSNDLLLILLDIAPEGSGGLCRPRFPGDPADYRLPFREIGLSIGLEGIKTCGLREAKPGPFLRESRRQSRE